MFYASASSTDCEIYHEAINCNNKSWTEKGKNKRKRKKEREKSIKKKKKHFQGN